MGSLPGRYSPLFSRHAAGGPYTIAGIDVCPSDVWFVDSTAANAADDARHGYTPDMPFATLAYAVTNSVTADDTIYVLPGHAETISTAGGITMDVAGVKVIGLGWGARRPTFTWSVAASTWLITAASCQVRNIVCSATTGADTTQGILVTAADVTLADIEAREPSATGQFVDFLTFHTGAARGRLDGFRYAGSATGDAGQSAVQVTAVVDSVRLENLWITGAFAAGAVESTAAATNILIREVRVEQYLAAQDGGIVLNAGTTGLIDRVRIKGSQHDANGFNLAIVAAGAAVYDALVVNLAGEVGGAWGTASTA